MVVSSPSGENIVVDTPPEFRLSAIRFGLGRVDCVLYTHSHADHIFGLDDLRIFNWLKKGPLPLYAERDALEDIKRAYRYCFIETQQGGGKPKIEPIEIRPGEMLDLYGIKTLPLRVMHGNLPILGYKFGEKAAYVTDVSEIPPESFERLRNLDLLFLDATRKEPHPTHYHLDKAIQVAAKLNAKQTYFIHLSHDYDFDNANFTLPAGIALSYDGMEVEIGD